MLRYKSTGEVHKDFHGLTCATLHYLADNYGQEAMEEILKNTAQKVYKTICDELKTGKCCELVEFWRYYFSRENGQFEISETENEVKLVVKDCPALRHLVELEQMPDPILCDATEMFNNALTENTPFEIITERTGTFSCVQILKKKGSQQ